MKMMLVCYHCNKAIKPEQGKIVQGNIYMITGDANERAGLLGSSNVMELKLKDVPESAFCDNCLKKIIHLDD